MRINDYSEEKIKEMLANATERNKEILSYFFGYNVSQRMTAKQLAKKYNLSESSINNIVKKAKTSTGTARKNRISEFVKSHEAEEVIIASKKMSEKYQNIIYDVCGIERETPLSIKDIANKEGISESAAYQLVLRVLNRMEILLDDQSLDSKHRLQRFKKILKDEDLAIIKEMLMIFDDKDIDIFMDYYGINGGKLLSISDISKKYGYHRNTIFKKLNNINRKLNTIISFSNASDNKKLNFLKSLSSEDIDYVYNKINPLEREIVSYYHEFEGNPSLSIESIANRNGKSVDEISIIVSKTINKVMAIISLRQEGKEMSSLRDNYFSKTFGNYSRAEVLEALSHLPKKEQEYFLCFYGIDRKKESANKIAKRYETKLVTFYMAVNRASKRIINILQGNGETYISPKRELVNKYIKKHGTNGLKAILNQYEAKEREVIVYYYGLDGNDQKSYTKISQLTGCAKTRVYNIAETFYNKVSKEYLRNSVARKKLEERFPNHSIEEINLAIKKLLPSQKELVERYYGLGGKKALSICEIAKKENHSKQNVSEKLKLACNKLELILNNNLFSKEKLDLGTNRKNI